MCTKQAATRHDATYRLCMLMILVAILATTALCFSKGISGNDFWWHVKVGEWIVENREVPTTDIFSWYGIEKGISWTAHEWLADVIFYVIHSALGNVGVFLFCMLASLALLFLLLSQAKEFVGNNFLLSGSFFVLFAVVASLFFYGRPHIFSYFLLSAELKILYEFSENHASKKVFLIPVLSILWSNLHGGSSNLSYVLCLVFLCAGLVPVSYERLECRRYERRTIVKMIGVTCGSVLGILVNPIGAAVFVYPYVNLSDDISMSVISEWQAPDAKVLGCLVLYFLPIFLMTVGIICGHGKIRMVDFLVMFSFLYLFFRSARFIILWYIAAVFYAFRYMPRVNIKQVTGRKEKVAVLMLLIILLVPCGIGVSEMIETQQAGNLISVAMSEEAIQAIKEDNPQRVFNDYNFGETLIYNDIPVFFDARADLYAQEGIMATGVSLMYLEPVTGSGQTDYVDVEGIVEKYGFDGMLIMKGRPLYSYVVRCSERFELIYEDGSLGYFRVVEVGVDE